MKKKLNKALVFIAIPLAATILIFNYAQYKVVGGEKYDEITNSTYGYKVEQNYFTNNMRLTIWNSVGVNITYNLTSLSIENVKTNQWLSNGRAIYLNLKIKYHDSIPKVVEARIIYDYQKGALYLTSPLMFGRSFDATNPVDKNWMTEAEFDEILFRLSQ